MLLSVAALSIGLASLGMTSSRVETGTPVRNNVVASTCTDKTAQKLVAGKLDSMFICDYGPAVFTIKRTRILTAEWGEQLLPGDIVSIDASACRNATDDRRAEVLNAGMLERVDCARTSITVGGQPPRDSLWDSVVARFYTLIGGVSADAYSQQSISAISRGEPPRLRMDILETPQTVSARSPLVDLPWDGGTAPFVVTLRRNGDGNRVTTLSSATSDLVFSPATLGLGTYRVRVTDAAGKHVGGEMTIRRAPLPSPGRDATDPSRAFTDPQVRQLWEAVWLSQNGAAYRVAAYTSLADAATTLPEAELYRQRLAGRI